MVRPPSSPFIYLLGLSFVACMESEPEFRRDLVLACDSEGECPAHYTCVEGVEGSVCISTNTEAPGICGDGVVSGDEVCDLGSQNRNAYDLEEGCRQDCSGPAPSCGDGN